MTNLVVEVNDLALVDDRVRVSCFRRAGFLVGCTKSEFDDCVKPQGIVSKMVAPDSHENIETNSETEFLAPAESVAPENQVGDVEDSDIHPDGVGQDENSEHGFVVEEDGEEQLLSTEILDDVEDVESDDDVKFELFLIFSLVSFLCAMNNLLFFF